MIPIRETDIMISGTLVVKRKFVDLIGQLQRDFRGTDVHVIEDRRFVQDRRSAARGGRRPSDRVLM